jgi:hypothetical protein
MRRPIQIPTTGQLDKDSDLQYLNTQKGDMPDLYDMEFSAEDVMTLTTAKGNVEKIDFGSASLQNQKVRIYWESSPNPTNIVISLKNVNDQNLFTRSSVSDGGLLGFQAAIGNIFQQSIFPSTVTVYPNEPYVDVEVDLGYSDWGLEIKDGSGADIFSYAVIQEAVSATGVGDFIPIGSYDFLGDMFYWVTTQRNLKTRMSQSVANAVGNNFSRSVVTIPLHGLKDYETIAINGVVGCTGVNGIWVIKVIDSNRVELQGSLFGGAYISGGEIFKDLYGYGAIGIAKYDLTSETFQWIPLLRSKKLNFVTKREFYQPQVEINGTLISMYYTDNYNVPRVTYYSGEYLTDGCIKALNPKGQYEYLTLDLEIANQLLFSGYTLSFQNQLQSGGKLKAGNKRYAIRFIAESGTPTELSLLTNPIAVYGPTYNSYTDFQNVYGGAATIDTGKVNILSLTGIIPGLFKFVELICFEYVGTTTSVFSVPAIIVRREPLTVTQTEIILEHNGSETEIVNYDSTTATQVQPRILTAADNVIIQNRLVYGNVTTGEDQYDLTEFCKTLKYSIKRKSLRGQGYLVSNGEFYDYRSTENSIGYQLWEWYRFYIVGEYLSGSLTPGYFAFDVRFVSRNDYNNVTNNPEKNFLNPNHPDWEFKETNITNRRDFNGDELNFYDLSINIGGEEIALWQYGIELKNVDWNYLVDGVPLKNIFRSFRVYRAELKKEVLASGVLNLAAQTFGVLDEFSDYVYSTHNELIYQPGNPNYPNVTTKTTKPYTTIPLDARRKFASFYVPDYYFNNATLESFANTSNDRIINFGQSNQNRIKLSGFKQNEFGAYWYLSFFSGSNSCNNSGVYAMQELAFCETGQTKKFLSGKSYTKRPLIHRYPSYQNQLPSDFWAITGNELGSYVIEFKTDVLNNGNFGDDFGLYNAVYFRKLKDKYGTTIYSNNDLLYTGAILNFPQTSTRVFGGDTFTQSTWIKKQLPNTASPQWEKKGGSSGFLITTQNKVNTNLRIWSSGKQVFPYIGTTTPQLNDWLYSNIFDFYEQNSGYQPNDKVQSRAVYNTDDDANTTNQYPTRKYYSELKPNGSRIDFYRIFLPINFQDNPAVQGSIFRVLNVNNELFTVQERGYTREYFNSRGQLVSPDQGQILIGDGSVLSRIGTNLTMFGSSNAGSVVIGKSQSGKDVVMFISAQFGQVLRFGDDGLVSVSLRERMRTFFNNNLKWAQEAKTPADGFGICGVWDNNNKQFIYTVKAWRQVDNWSVATTYNQGAIVQKGYDNQGVAKLWVLTATSSRGDLPGSSPVWQLIPTTDNNYYNVYTFTWSELKNAFTQFYSYLPNHYAEWNGTLLSSYPDLDSNSRSLTYQHGIGNPAEYYGIEFPGGKVSVVCNWQRDLNKKFFSLMLNGKGKPERVDITSLFRDENDDEIIKVSFLLASDFETRESYSYAPVKLELDANGSNDGDTGQIEGIWAKFAITYPVGKKSSLTTFVAYIRDSFRNFTR